MYFTPDLECKQKYKCPACGGRVYKALNEEGKRVFVHQTMNNYAEHAKHCPKRKPDILNNN